MKQLLLLFGYLFYVITFVCCDSPAIKHVSSSSNVEVDKNPELIYTKKTKKVLLKLRNTFTKKVNNYVKKDGVVDVDGIIKLIKNGILGNIGDDVFNAYVIVSNDDYLLYRTKLYVDKIASIEDSHTSFKSEGNYGSFLRTQEDLKVNFISKDSIYKNATLIKTTYHKDDLKIQLDFLLTNTAFVKPSSHDGQSVPNNKNKQ